MATEPKLLQQHELVQLYYSRWPSVLGFVPRHEWLHHNTSKLSVKSTCDSRTRRLPYQSELLRL